MKKFVAIMMLGLLMGAAVSAQAETSKGRGGVVGFFAGCCFGPRAGADYNSGKSIHWREWGRYLPYVGIIFPIWSAIDGASGVSTEDYAKQYGTTFY